MSDGTSAAQARYGLALLTALSFFNYLDRMVMAVLVEPIKRDLHLSDTQMGLVAGFAFALLYALAGLPIARLADRSSRVKLVSACLVVWSAMTALTGFARSFLELFAARMAVGIGEAGCVPASHSLLGDLFPPRHRALAIGIFQAGGLVGMSFGLALAGWLAQTYGWRTALMVSGFAGIPLALLMILTMREPVRTGPPVDASESTLAATAILFRRRAFVHLVIGLSVGAFATYGMSQWISAFYVRSHGLTLAAVGLWGGIAGGGGGIAGAIAGGAAMTRLRERDARWEQWFPMMTYALSGPVYAAGFLVASSQLAFVLQFVATFIAASGGAVALASLQSFAEPHRRATAVAIMLMLSSLIGLGAGPTAVGMISDLLAPATGSDSLRYALALSTVILLWAAFHFWQAGRTSMRDQVSVAG
jgi:predicted MFS family arabinose efflux permease